MEAEHLCVVIHIRIEAGVVLWSWFRLSSDFLSDRYGVVFLLWTFLLSVSVFAML